MTDAIDDADEPPRYWAGYFAKFWMYAVRMQAARIRDNDGQSWSVDVQLLVTALCRLRKTVDLAAGLGRAAAPAMAAGRDFDRAVPGLRLLRDAAEHLEDYGRGRGRDQSVSRPGLASDSWDGRVFRSYLREPPVELDLQATVRAAEVLSECIRDLHPETRVRRRK